MSGKKILYVLLAIGIILPSSLKSASKGKKIQNTDVIVCGGGPSGFAAAISSARNGAKTILIEQYGALGGVWTTGMLTNIIDYQNKTGIISELLHRLQKSDAQYNAKVSDVELMKVTLDQMCLEAGVEVHLYSRVVDAKVNRHKRIDYIVTESNSGKEYFAAKVYIDATGNGDLGALAGCGFDYGHPESGKTQPLSLMAIVSGLDEDSLVANGLIARNGLTTENSKEKFYLEIKRAGVDCSYSMPTMFAIRRGMIAVMANHEYGFSALNAEDMTKATMQARQELNQIFNALRNLGGIWSNVRIISTAGQIGIREGRRIHGLYKLTADDLIKGARFKDAVCRVTFCVDVHSLEKKNGVGYSEYNVKAQPYDIPLRSLIAKDVKGLMMAGRCISGDFFAHASYRVTGNSVATGEAAGKVGAQAALQNKLPQDIEYKLVLK